MRLDNFLTKALNISRSDASIIIKKQHVYVNGQQVLKKDFHINENKDIVKVNDQLIDYKEFIYIMLNKPQGVVCAVRDKKDKTVIDILDQNIMHIKEIFPIGRLDKDTEGLLILTNDGQLSHKIANPNHEVYKEYYVKTLSKLSANDCELFCNGLEILDGNDKLFVTKKAKMKILSDNECIVSICEGKFHQIKRMFEKLNNKVIYLKRVAYGNIKLDDRLKLGEYRCLTLEELVELKKER